MHSASFLCASMQKLYRLPSTNVPTHFQGMYPGQLSQRDVRYLCCQPKVIIRRQPQQPIRWPIALKRGFCPSCGGRCMAETAGISLLDRHGKRTQRQGTLALANSRLSAEAATVFGDPKGLDWQDLTHSINEMRYKRLGLSVSARQLLVVYTLRRHKDGKETIRIISARQANKKERQAYSRP